MEENDVQLLPQLIRLPKRDAVILAAGDFPSSSLALETLRKVPHIVCCDGAYRQLHLSGMEADAVVGDGDSLTTEEKVNLKQLLHLVPEQETNDLTKAVRYALSQGWHRLLIMGATGKREDHTLGNLSLLAHYQAEGLDVALLTDHGLFCVCQGSGTYASFPSQQISVFNLSSRVLSSRGLVYDCYPFEEIWQGTLNEAQNTEFSIQADGCYVIFFLAGSKVEN